MSKTIKITVLFLDFAMIGACSSKPCDDHAITQQTSAQVAAANTQSGTSGTTQKQESSQAMNDQVKAQDLTKRVRVFKPDGSLQCGMGKKIDLSTMQKELGDMKVYSSENKHDGLMRVQVCGHPTGNCNVFEIDGVNLEKASKLGFKKWLRD